MRVCIVVPMYNEEAIAKHSIETIMLYVKQLPPIATILVVNDGSCDATGDVLKDLASQYKETELRVISHSKNKGYGAAHKSGIKFAIDNNYDYVIFMDSDLTDHPKYLRAFYEKMTEGWDYIKASRYIKTGGTKGIPWKRLFLSKCGNIFAKIITGLPLTDFTNGFRCAKVNILKQIDLIEDEFPIIIEELMKANKITDSFCEIPYILEARSKESGPTKFKYNFATFYKYLKYLFFA